MEISARAKERFCKDCNIPVRLFQEPYFIDRLTLFDKFYGTLEKWKLFVKELECYKCEQDYFEEYNRVKDEAINCIKNSEAYQRFNTENMNKYRVTHENLPNKDIFKPANDGRTFISIDMKKANFSSLLHYCKNIGESMFADASEWIDFMSFFTDNKHIANSKYIRQVILGNCNPKRHITYEKWLMDNVLGILDSVLNVMDKVVFFSNDEIVLDVTDINESNRSSYFVYVQNTTEKIVNVPLRVELFTLYKIQGTDGYCKEIFNNDGENKIEFKCLDNYMMPFVIRHFLGEEITDSDKVFYHEGLLAQFIEVPKIEVNMNESI